MISEIKKFEVKEFVEQHDSKYIYNYLKEDNAICEDIHFDVSQSCELCDAYNVCGLITDGKYEDLIDFLDTELKVSNPEYFL